jgi:hypothetical protein
MSGAQFQRTRFALDAHVEMHVAVLRAERLGFPVMGDDLHVGTAPAQAEC